jgi:hypothetical protein
MRTAAAMRIATYGKVFVRASREASNFELSHRADVAEVLSDVVGLVAISDTGARDTLLALVPLSMGVFQRLDRARYNTLADVHAGTVFASASLTTTSTRRMLRLVCSNVVNEGWEAFKCGYDPGLAHKARVHVAENQHPFINTCLSCHHSLGDISRQNGT